MISPLSIDFLYANVGIVSPNFDDNQRFSWSTKTINTLSSHSMMFKTIWCTTRAKSQFMNDNGQWHDIFGCCSTIKISSRPTIRAMAPPRSNASSTRTMTNISGTCSSFVRMAKLSSRKWRSVIEGQLKKENIRPMKNGHPYDGWTKPFDHRLYRSDRMICIMN